MPRKKKELTILKDNKISIAELLQKINDNNLDFIIDTISFDRMAQFVTNVVDSCFEGGRYAPYYKDFAFRINVLSEYANVKLEDKQQMFDACYVGTEDYIPYEIIYKNINNSQLVLIENCIDEMIDFNKQCILKMINSKSDDVMENINDLISNLNTIVGKIGKYVDNIDIQDIIKLIPALSNLGENFNQESAVKQILDNNEQKLNKKDSKIVNIKE